MSLPVLPDSVPFVRIEAALARFGIPVRDLAELTLGTAAITTVHFRRDENDQRIVAGQELATITTVIPYSH